jgi:hypothetical protein
MVREWDNDPIQPMPMARANVMMYKDEEAAQEEQVGLRKIKLAAQITAQFEIK